PHGLADPARLRELDVDPVRALGTRGDVAKRVAVLVDEDRERRALLQLGAAGIAGRQRLLAVLDTELGELRQELERLREAPGLVHVHLERQVAGDAADGTDALDVEAVPAAELELEAAEAGERLLRAARHVVGVPEPDRPARRRAGAPQAEEPPDRLAEQLPLQVVESRVDRRARRELACGEPRHDLLERERIVPDRGRVLLDLGKRRSRGLAVPLDRRRLAEAGDARMAQLDDQRLRRVGRSAGDDERLRELELDDPGGDLHEGRGYTHLVVPAPVAQGIERAPPEREVAGSIPAGRTSSYGK